MKINIIYEDNHLLVVEKPVNIPVQADHSGDMDILTILKQGIKIRYQKPGNVYLGLVHRLDRPVGGVMVFAKTSKAASRLSDSIRRGNFNRSYLAVTRGAPSQQSARLEHFLYKDQQKNIVHAVSSKHKQAKKAALTYEVLDKQNALGLLAVTLHTGRSHQIRVQLAETGTPLYGDQKYGSKYNKPGQQIALWAHRLGLEHPTTKEWLEFQCLPPQHVPWQYFTI